MRFKVCWTVMNESKTRIKLMTLGVTMGSKILSRKKGTIKSTQVKLEYPSTGAMPGWETRPFPAAKFLAYTNEMPASSMIHSLKNQACAKNRIKGKTTGHEFLIVRQDGFGRIGTLWTLID